MNKQLAATVLLVVGVVIVLSTLHASTQSETTPPQVQSRIIDGETIYSGTGKIQGNVHNAEGQPVAGTTITLDSVDMILKGLPFATSDEEGKFLIRNVPPGVYRIYGENKAAGYPSTSSSFFDSRPTAPQVNILPDQATSGVAVYLGSKAAKLVGEIVEATTRKAIKNSRIILRRVDNPGNFYSTGLDSSGKFSILVPSVPITIEVSAPGYKKWHYRRDGSGNQADALQLSPADTQNLTVALRPNR